MPRPKDWLPHDFHDERDKLRRFGIGFHIHRYKWVICYKGQLLDEGGVPTRLPFNTRQAATWIMALIAARWHYHAIVDDLRRQRFINAPPTTPVTRGDCRACHPTHRVHRSTRSTQTPQRRASPANQQPGRKAVRAVTRSATGEN